MMTLFALRTETYPTDPAQNKMAKKKKKSPNINICRLTL